MKKKPAMPVGVPWDHAVTAARPAPEELSAVGLVLVAIRSIISDELFGSAGDLIRWGDRRGDRRGG